MKKRKLLERFPGVNNFEILPVSVQFTQVHVIGDEEKGETPDFSKIKYVSIHDFQTSEVQQRGGFYKPISKLITIKK